MRDGSQSGEPSSRLSLAGMDCPLAVFSSLVMQLVLDGELGPVTMPKIAFPWNFAFLFGAAVPIMGLASFLSLWYTIQLPGAEVGRPPLVSGVLGGIGKFLGCRTFVLITVVYLAICAGSDSILPNVTMYTKDALGETPEKYIGYQYALRFGFKVAAGFVLGWLLARANAKAALLATIVFSVGGLAWALVVIANTIRGKGVSFLEDRRDRWLYQLSEEEFALACDEISGITRVRQAAPAVEPFQGAE